MYEVFNITDGIPAAREPFKTLGSAKKFCKEFIKRYETQGYYFTNKMQRIKPEFVELSISNEEGDEVFNNQYGEVE